MSEDRQDERLQAAEARELCRWLRSWHVHPLARRGVKRRVERFHRWADTVDALSVRLAQECALRAQAEQDVSLLRRERDEARAEAELANAACSGENGRFYRKWARTQERLRVADALLREYEKALKAVFEVAAVAYEGDPWYCENEGVDAEAAFALARPLVAASGGREA